LVVGSLAMFLTSLATQSSAQDVGPQQQLAYDFVTAVNRGDYASANAVLPQTGSFDAQRWVTQRGNEYGLGGSPHMLDRLPNPDGSTRFQLLSALPRATIETDVTVACFPQCKVVNIREQLR